MASFSRLPTPSSFFSAYASISTSIMLLRTMLDQIIPPRAQSRALSTIVRYFKPHSRMITVFIDQMDGIASNELYDAAETYLSTKISPNIERLRLSKRPKDSSIRINFAKSEKIEDFYQGIELQWQFIHEELHDSKKVDDGEKKYFELKFQNKYKEIVLNSYIPFVLQKSNEIRDERKVVKLHTLSSMHSYSSSVIWDSINLNHPSTFDNLAMEESLKKAIIQDLDKFVRRKSFYKRVGKAWKRGYLLYGPPGTGKSSLIAAIANYLKFDIYDLDLANVSHDSILKKLFLRTSNRSIIVIEDIDCSVKLPERHGNEQGADERPTLNHEFTLSGLLNFMDGLWSSCGDERIIIFTTNDKDRLDPAILRPGRMDMHIHMSYLTPNGFKLLASNYLNINYGNGLQSRFGEIEKLINEVNVTPAEIAEELMKSDDGDANASLDGVVKFLKRKKSDIDGLMMEEKGKRHKIDGNKIKENGVSHLVEKPV